MLVSRRSRVGYPVQHDQGPAPHAVPAFHRLAVGPNESGLRELLQLTKSRIEFMGDREPAAMPVPHRPARAMHQRPPAVVLRLRIPEPSLLRRSIELAPLKGPRGVGNEGWNSPVWLVYQAFLPRLIYLECGDSPSCVGRKNCAFHLRRINRHTHRPSEISMIGMASAVVAGMGFAFGQPWANILFA